MYQWEDTEKEERGTIHCLQPATYTNQIHLNTSINQHKHTATHYTLNQQLKFRIYMCVFCMKLLD